LHFFKLMNHQDTFDIHFSIDKSFLARRVTCSILNFKRKLQTPKFSSHHERAQPNKPGLNPVRACHFEMNLIVQEARFAPTKVRAYTLGTARHGSRIERELSRQKDSLPYIAPDDKIFPC
jgi:hypothetical protein